MGTQRDLNGSLINNRDETERNGPLRIFVLYEVRVVIHHVLSDIDPYLKNDS